jgi:hypothetical protein
MNSKLSSHLRGQLPRRLREMMIALPVFLVLSTTSLLAADPALASTSEQAKEAAKASQKFLQGLFRNYEPTQVGLTKDQGDDAYMDFTLSVMFPVLHGYYPDRKITAKQERTDPFPNWKHLKFYPYFAATIRDGFYVTTRPSSPVVGKRFNPLLAFRSWAYDSDKAGSSLDQFFEVVYAHESNGQIFANPDRFNEQVSVYLRTEKDQNDQVLVQRAYRSARDNISRGWDYWGVHASYDFDYRDIHITTLAKFDYYLRHGLLQGSAEEYNKWENDSQGKRRRFVDGLSLRTTLQTRFWHPFKWVELDGRFVLTWTTGTQNPFQYHTWKAETGFRVANFPVLAWYRSGYNSDVIDYYRKDSSWGVTLSFWNF